MRSQFITCNPDSSRLLLVFAGWSTDPAFYCNVVRDGWDTLVCYGYDNFDFDRIVLQRYKTVVVYAWSLGVYAAMRALDGYKPAAAFAIAGTGRPIHDELGIPRDIFIGTRDNLDARSLAKFRRRMFRDSVQFEGVKQYLPQQDDIEQLKHELTAIIESEERGSSFKWTHAYCTANDRIFPCENQLNYWAGNTPHTVLNSPHFIEIADIVAHTLPDTSAIADSFNSAVESYDEYAEPQHKIAERLAEIASGLIPPHGHILEIGSFTGSFTRMWSRSAMPSQCDFVELYPVKPYCIAPIENYFVCNAEEWLDNESKVDADRYDAIMSASAMQWFVDPRRFLINSRKLLKPGCSLVCSTFIDGNLGELDALRPAPIPYLTRDRICDMLSDAGFVHYEVIEMPVRVTFATKRDLMLHLKRTGVTPKHDSTLKVYGAETATIGNTLTYRGALILATK